MGRKGGREGGREEGRKEVDWRDNVRVTSIPSTNLSLTARSTPFTVSFTASVALLRTTREVEKARGAKVVVVVMVALVVVRRRRGVLVRKDIFLLDCFVLLI